jgi:hypothetical protein
VQALPLEVGDRLMFVTDGMLERDAELVNISAILTASRACTRAKRCSTSPRRFSARAVASCATTPLCSVSIGREEFRATVTPIRGQTARSCCFAPSSERRRSGDLAEVF